MVVVPAIMPVTTPDEDTVAITGFPLDQTPPAVSEPNVFVKPTQVDVGPVIGAGSGFTVTTAEERQPLAPPII
jgi:hypothetical protein